MAKGNLFQGMGRGKVGDVVFSRLNGEQLSRVRNRNPKNPNTNKQLYQRAIMATVMQAYSAGIVIFDHAFQGREIGAANQRRFISLNAKLLRSQVAADIKGGVALEDQQGRVVAPGVSSPVAAALQVSEGTLRNVLFGSTVPQPLTDETVGAYCARVGLVAGDLFTFVAFKNDFQSEVLFSVNGVDSDMAKQFKTQFLFARYAVKESAISDTTTAFANLAQVLELTDSNFSPRVDFSIYDGGEEAPRMQYMCGVNTYGTCGWIRSRKNSDLRSKCVLSFDGEKTGIASQYALQAWSQGTANLGNSDLILEGGGGVEPAPAMVVNISSYHNVGVEIQGLGLEDGVTAIGVATINGEQCVPFVKLGTPDSEHPYKYDIGVAGTKSNQNKAVFFNTNDQYDLMTFDAAVEAISQALSLPLVQIDSVPTSDNADIFRATVIIDSWIA